MKIIQYFNGIGKWGVDPNDLYGSSAQANAISGEQVIHSLNMSVNSVFTIITVIVCAALGLALLLPGMKGAGKTESDDKKTDKV